MSFKIGQGIKKPSRQGRTLGKTFLPMSKGQIQTVTGNLNTLLAATRQGGRKVMKTTLEKLHRSNFQNAASNSDSGKTIPETVNGWPLTETQLLPDMTTPT